MSTQYTSTNSSQENAFQQPLYKEYSASALQERQRLARELHDSVSQALYGISLCAHNARAALETDPQQAAAPLEHVIRFAEQGIAEVRALLFDLRADSLQTQGLIAALHNQVTMLRTCYRLKVESILGSEPVVTLEIKHALYRIAQEALHNVVKHAHADSVVLQLTVLEHEIILEVRDDGTGFDVSIPRPGHLGLCSMQERATTLNGIFNIESTPGCGTRICVHLPVRDREDLLVIGRTVS